MFDELEENIHVKFSKLIAKSDHECDEHIDTDENVDEYIDIN